MKYPTLAIVLAVACAACGRSDEPRPHERDADSSAWRGGDVGLQEASARTGYVDEVDFRGRVVDAVAYLLRGEPGDAGSARALALETSDGLFLLLPDEESSSDDDERDRDDADEAGTAFDLSTLRVGERVTVTGELYRRGGLEGIEVESVRRD